MLFLKVLKERRADAHKYERKHESETKRKAKEEKKKKRGGKRGARTAPVLAMLKMAWAVPSVTQLPQRVPGLCRACLSSQDEGGLVRRVCIIYGAAVSEP